MEADLQTRARQAYERGRLRAALPWILPALVLGSGAIALHGDLRVLPVMLLLAGFFVLANWRGGELARGLPLGLAVGTITAAYPLFLSCGACGVVCQATCTSVTALGAGLAGLFMLRSRTLPQAASALVTAGLIAGMGCISVGVGGLIGVVVVVTVGSAAAAIPVLRSTPA